MVLPNVSNPDPIVLPPNRNARIWRYIEPWKLESILKERALYFTRGDQFDDPYEGLLPESLKTLPEFEHLVRHHLYCRSHGYASCWSMCEYESATMWKLFARRGVALKSTFSRLEHAFGAHRAANGLERVDVGMVQYDPAYLGPHNNIRKVLFHKRPNFDSEREVRAIFHRLDLQGSGNFADPTVPISELIHPTRWVPRIGELVPIEPETLITGIVTDPTEPSIYDQVARLLDDYGSKIHLERSTLFTVEYLGTLSATRP